MIARILEIPSELQGEISAITTHSAMCEKGDLFVALPGENFNGASFIKEAREKGAFILSEADGADFRVKCAYEALLKIACSYKEIINPKHTIAVTGSIGKTTVKDFIYTLLSPAMHTHKTEENYNNILGVSYTLLSMPKNTEALVIEIGMNHKGEIDTISRALKPTLSVITNVGSAHIGNLGSRDAIAEAKLEIQNGMTGGKTVIFKEEALLSKAKNIYSISYTDVNADLFADIISRDRKESRIYIKTKEYAATFNTTLYSKHSINSLLMAIAVCDVIGIRYQTIADAINNITPDTMRQKFIYANGYTFYDDSYNSSPEAVVADLSMLSELGGERSALIGDMLELGESSSNLHRYIGIECARHSLKKLYALGQYAGDIACGAILGGMKESDIFINTDINNPGLTAKQISENYAGEVLLVKASHSVNAKRIIEILSGQKEDL